MRELMRELVRDINKTELAQELVRELRVWYQEAKHNLSFGVFLFFTYPQNTNEPKLSISESAKTNGETPKIKKTKH
jgi:hypothetical protein